MLIIIGILYALLFACGIASTVCFIMVVVQMFKHDKSSLGIICIVLAFCGGPLIGFVYGWVKSAEWDIKKLMLAWTGTIVLSFLLVGGVLATAALMMPTDVNQEQFIQDAMDDMDLNIDLGGSDFDFSEGLPEGLPDAESDAPAPAAEQP